MRMMTANFPGTCKTCKGPIAKGEMILWASGEGARHADASACEAFRSAAQPAPAVETADLKPIADFILAARDRGLKFPKARFLAPNNREFRLSIAGEQSKAPGSVQVVLDDKWIGRVQPEGAVVGSLAYQPELVAALLGIAADPAAAAAAYGALMCRCSFCDTALTDEGSVEVGYGPICAKRYGLPHHPKGTRQLVKPAVVDDSAIVNELDALYASLSDRDEMPADRRAALESRVRSLEAR